MSSEFGDLFKELRLKSGQTLRQYCRNYGEDPANISKIERGKVKPPLNSERLAKLAKSVSLKESTEEWQSFIDLAQLSAGRIPDSLLNDKETISNLPIMMRTLRGKKLTKDQIKKLIDLVRSE